MRVFGLAGLMAAAVLLPYPVDAQVTDAHLEHYDKPIDWVAKGQAIVQAMPTSIRNGTPLEKSQYLAAQVAEELHRNGFTADYSLGTRFTTARSLKCSEIAEVFEDAFKALEKSDRRVRTFQVAVRNLEAARLDMNVTHTSLGVMLESEEGDDIRMIDLWQHGRENGGKLTGFKGNEWNSVGYLAWCNQMMMAGYDELTETVDLDEELQHWDPIKKSYLYRHLSNNWTDVAKRVMENFARRLEIEPVQGSGVLPLVPVNDNPGTGKWCSWGMVWHHAPDYKSGWYWKVIQPPVNGGVDTATTIELVHYANRRKLPDYSNLQWSNIDHGAFHGCMALLSSSIGNVVSEIEAQRRFVKGDFETCILLTFQAQSSYSSWEAKARKEVNRLAEVMYLALEEELPSDPFASYRNRSAGAASPVRSPSPAPVPATATAPATAPAPDNGGMGMNLDLVDPNRKAVEIDWETMRPKKSD